jgi:hypothetical protein
VTIALDLSAREQATARNLIARARIEREKTVRMNAADYASPRDLLSPEDALLAAVARYRREHGIEPTRTLADLEAVPGADRECAHCGAAFVSSHGSKKYCSPKCRMIVGKRRRKQRWPMRECAACGETFRARDDQRHCSRSCSNRTRERPEREPRHGTISEYNGQGCRCPECKAAIAAYHRARLAAAA